LHCIDKLRRVWTLGYEATSISELRSVMGITQASLYAAFGNREQLFREAVDLNRKTAGTLLRRLSKRSQLRVNRSRLCYGTQ
jgi:AcrR family transcriptional regulator